MITLMSFLVVTLMSFLVAAGDYPDSFLAAAGSYANVLAAGNYPDVFSVGCWWCRNVFCNKPPSADGELFLFLERCKAFACFKKD